MIYRGDRMMERSLGPGRLRVMVGPLSAGQHARLLAPRTDLRRHSPTGFECGYEGSGPAQLALAICAEHLSRHDLRAQSAVVSVGWELRPLHAVADRVALLVYQPFKRRVVARLPRDRSWTIFDDEVAAAIDSIVAENVTRERERKAVNE